MENHKVIIIIYAVFMLYYTARYIFIVKSKKHDFDDHSFELIVGLPSIFILLTAIYGTIFHL